LRGELLVSASPNAAGDGDVAAFGFIVVSEAAAAVGGTSVPGPILNPEADWIWHSYVPLRSLAATAADDTAIGCFSRVLIDSKAMRRVKKDQEVIFVTELSTGEFASVIVTGGIRALVMLA